MLEIHLTEEHELPTVTTDLDGTIRLKMSWHTGIEEALDLNSDHISSGVKDNFRLLFIDRDIQREFEKTDKVLVIRQVENLTT